MGNIEKKDKKYIGGSSWYPWEAIAVIFIGFFVSSLPYQFVEKANSGIGVDLVAYTLQVGCFFLLPLLFTTYMRSFSPAALGFYRPDIRHCLRTGISCGCLFYLINILISLIISFFVPELLNGKQDVLELFEKTNSSFEIGILILFLVIVSPIAEEMVFRAYFLPPMVSRFGKAIGFSLTAAVFALSHLDLHVFLQLFVGGLCFNWLYNKYQNIYYNIVAHGTWNFLALTLFMISSANKF